MDIFGKEKSIVAKNNKLKSKMAARNSRLRLFLEVLTLKTMQYGYFSMGKESRLEAKIDYLKFKIAIVF